MLMIDSLSVSQVNKEQAGRTIGPYFFLVSMGAMPFTAFRTKYGFLRWLNARGLKLTKPLTPVGVPDYQSIKGHYYERSLSIADFEAFSNSHQFGRRIYQMSNGDYVPAIASPDAEDGSVIVTYPHSGLGEEPKLQFWKGEAIEDGTCFKGIRPTPGPDWLFSSPKELIEKAESLPESSLSDVEKAMMVSSWLQLVDRSPDTPPLKNRGLVKEMTFG
jgi:hypothetical protein